MEAVIINDPFTRNLLRAKIRLGYRSERFLIEKAAACRNSERHLWANLIYTYIHTYIYLLVYLFSDAKEPIFQYDFPKPYVTPQTWFPLRQPFNLYLDKYRDPKDTMKEFLLRKLKTVHPFKEPKPPLKYPNACVLDLKAPSWLRVQTKKERLGWGRVHDLK